MNAAIPVVARARVVAPHHRSPRTRTPTELREEEEGEVAKAGVDEFRTLPVVRPELINPSYFADSQNQ